MIALSAALLLSQGATAAKPWTLVAGGDIMLNAVRPSADVFKDLAPTLWSADVAYGNLEIPLTDQRSSTPFKTAAEVKARSQYILKGHPDHVWRITQAGFSLVSLGNNHAMDYRASGLKQMTEALDQAGITWAGAGKDRTEAERVGVVKLANGMNVGMISYLSFLGAGSNAKCGPAGENRPGIAALTLNGASGKKERARIRAIVERARADCDFLIVALHWGIERQPQPRPTQVSMGRLFIDEGADIVLGAHPHVLQPGEIYRGKPIIYSLGNLVSPTPANSAFYRFEFDGTALKSVGFLPTSISGGRVKLLDATSAGIRRKAALSQQTTFHKLYPNKNSAPLLPMATKGKP